MSRPRAERSPIFEWQLRGQRRVARRLACLWQPRRRQSPTCWSHRQTVEERQDVAHRLRSGTGGENYSGVSQGISVAGGERVRAKLLASFARGRIARRYAQPRDDEDRVLQPLGRLLRRPGDARRRRNCGSPTPTLPPTSGTTMSSPLSPPPAPSKPASRSSSLNRRTSRAHPHRRHRIYSPPE